VTGHAAVHLTGNYVIDYDDEPSPYDMDGEEFDDEDDEELDEEMDFDEDDEDDEEDDDEDDDEEEMDEEEIEALMKALAGDKRKAAKAEKSSGLKKAKIVEVTEEEAEKLLKKPKEAPAAAEKKKAEKKEAEVKQDKKKQQEKQQQEKKPAEVEKKKDEKKEQQQKSTKQTLPSGLVLEDVIVGTGPRAKNGNKVSVRYIGRLTNGKVFDSNTGGGKPFQFKLGQGQVIKGWDLGVQ
jgi:FK506-binding nuclear protein